MNPSSLLALVAVAASASVPHPGSRPEPAPVRVAYLQNDLHHLPLWVALDEGFFRDEGLAVEVAGVFRNGSELVSAFRAGDFDVAYVGQAPATIAAARGTAGLEFLALVNAEGSEIIVRADGPLRSVADLRGKTIAIPGIGSVQDLLVRKALRAAGIDDASAKVIVLRAPEMEAALRDGQIDAFIAWEPHPARARASGAGRTLVSSRRIWPGHPCCVLVAGKRFVAAHRATVAAVARAHRRAIAFIRERPEQAIAVAVRYTGFDAAIVRDALAHVAYEDRLSRADEEEVVRALGALGYIDRVDPARFVEGLLGKPAAEKTAR